MTYMTFKIKKDWLFFTLFGVSLVANLILLILFIASIANGEGPMIALATSMGLIVTAINVYLIYSLVKNFTVGLTKDSVRVSDISTVVIPYTSIRSIKKDREPSKYKLYDAVLVIKYNKYDTVRVNCEDLENTFDNLKEMVQKANLDKIVNNVVTNKDGSKEIQQTAAGQTRVIQATSAPTGATIMRPDSQVSGAPVGTVLKPVENQNVVLKPVENQNVVLKPVENQNVVLKPVENQNVVLKPVENQQTAGAIVRPAGTTTTTTTTRTVTPTQQVVKPASTTTTTTRVVTPTTTQVVPQKTTTTTTTTKKAVTAGQSTSDQPNVVTNTVINPDGTKKVVTTTTTTKKAE